MTEWYDSPSVKSTEMLSFVSVVEAYGLIYPRLSGENSSFACLISHKQLNHVLSMLELLRELNYLANRCDV